MLVTQRTVLTNNTVTRVPNQPLPQHEIGLRGQWLKMGSTQPWASLQGSKAFSVGWKWNGPRGIEKTPSTSPCFTCCNYRYGMFFTSRKRKWKVDLKKDVWLSFILLGQLIHLEKISYSSSCSNQEDKGTWAQCSNLQTSWFTLQNVLRTPKSFVYVVYIYQCVP